MFEKKKKTKKFHYGESAHTQWLTELADNNLTAAIKKEKARQAGQPKRVRVGKSYMINKLLEEL